MGLGKSTKSANERGVLFVDLKFAPNKGEGFVGFRETVSKTPRPDAKEGERKFDYEYKMHDNVDGELINFRVKEEGRFDNPDEKVLIGYATFRDVNDPTFPDVVVKYPLLSQAGRKLTGLLNEAVHKKVGSVYLYTNFAAAGTLIGDTPLKKDSAFINAKVRDASGDRLTPLYLDEAGRPLLDENGKPAPLPKGEVHVINRKEVWDFTKADEIVSATASYLLEHFKGEAHEDAHQEDEIHQDDDIDLEEAAQAAVPR